MIFTEAPPNLLSFKKYKRADFLSKSVLPFNCGNPEIIIRSGSPQV